jgi:RHS repeat-associated protein
VDSTGLAFDGRDVAALTLGERVEIDAQRGAAVLRVPVPVPPGRDDFGLSLTLTHSSTAGSSAFGAGWSLDGLPTIGLDTRLRLPRWDGADGLRFGADEIVPWLEETHDGWAPRGFVDGDHSVSLLRRRRGSSQLRVERWVHESSGRVHFRSRDARNVLTIYGARPSAAARISDPEDETRTLTWLPELLIDPRGNVLWIEYAAETLAGVDRTSPSERRQPSTAQRYLKRIRYGNVAPFALDERVLAGTLPDGVRWCFQVVLDYGDHSDARAPSAEPDRPWTVRRDPFSSFRYGFETRTYRLCRRILSFHDFDELGSGPTLVRALELAHDEDPAGTTLREIRSVGFRREDGVVTSKALPPLRMTYAPAATETSFQETPPITSENVPAGLSARRFTFVDLFGEGLPGILAESEKAWFYKRNLGDGEFDAQCTVIERPATTPDAFVFGDLDRDGNTELSLLAGRLAGSFELDRDRGRWRGFSPFEQLPHVEAMGAGPRWVDLNGDGRPDLVVAKHDTLLWFPSEGRGFGPPIQIPRPLGLEAAPTLEADPTLDFFFADMTGDGLADLVRVRNGSVEYWPSLGNGRFADRVVMEGAPELDGEGDFDPRRLRFVDLDGSGTSDLVYVGAGEVRCWINASGNALLPGPRLAGLPCLDDPSKVYVTDFLGDGRSCLVWSSPLPGRDSPLEHLSLTPSTPPRLLVAVDDSRGRETRIVYSSSASHYRRDVASGRGWSTRLPSHHPVVDRCEIVDRVRGTSSLQRFEYHDGDYDGVERETRGFGQVDVYDAKTIDSGVGMPSDAFATPSLVRTWFHLGAAMTGVRRPTDVYVADGALPRQDPDRIDDALGLLPDELDDGLRVLAGKPIRREIFAVGANDVPAPHPFEVQQTTWRLRALQPSFGRCSAAFSGMAVEEATWTYEQAAGDPRVRHSVVVEADALDVPTREASIAYARRSGSSADVPSQTRDVMVVRDRSYVHVDEPGRFELGVLAEEWSSELEGVHAAGEGLVGMETLRAPAVSAALASPAPHDADPPGPPPPAPRARRITWERTFHWNSARDAALPLGEVGDTTLVHHVEAACFTPAFVSDALGGRMDAATLAALGYVERDGHWWRPDAVRRFTPRGELSRLAALERSDGAAVRWRYDPYRVAPTSRVDALENEATAEIDYHRLAPKRITDANGFVTEARYDELGVIVTTSPSGHAGDAPWGFDPLALVVARAPSSLAEAIADPSHWLQGAATFVAYDLDAWSREGKPTSVLTLTAEALLHDGPTTRPGPGAIGVRIDHLDGLGRVLQSKSKVEGGPAIARDAAGRIEVDAGGSPVLVDAAVRWRVSGHVVYDEKQNPVRLYDPFFSPAAEYEGDDVLARLGVATLTTYDAVGRPVRRDLPNGAFESIRYGPWSVERADANDNVVGSAYGLLRAGRPTDDPERQAYDHAAAHAGTTSFVFFDPLGRESGSLERGGPTAPDRKTEARLDVLGGAVEVTDPRGIVALRHARDMLGRALHVTSVDAGERWIAVDAFDRVVTTWDGRGFRTDRGYDRGNRPTFVEVHGGDGDAPLDHRIEQWTYGESSADRAAAIHDNQLGRVVVASDGAGQTTFVYDPEGRVLSATRVLRRDVYREPDWRTDVPLETSEPFITSFDYDALGRVRSDTLADGATRTFERLASGGVTRVRVTTPDGSLVDEAILDGASYGARGERLGRTLGNGVGVAWGYDPQTHRIAAQTATRGAQRLQAMRYTFDPVGNLVRFSDAAQEGPDSIITGIAVSSRRDQIYDAHYRLRSATGRVHQALLQYDFVPGTKETIKGTRHITLDNGAAVERCTRTYDYDASGNLRFIQHAGAAHGWTTDMWISPTSNRSLAAIDPSGASVVDPEARFDGAGNVRRLSHLERIDWTFRGALGRAVVIARPGATDDDERYVYGNDGLRVRRVTTRVLAGGQIETTEKIYLGDVERKRVRIGDTNVLERWTLHVRDDTERVALVHRWTKDTLAREVDAVGAAKVHYHLTTHQGSCALELDAAGRVMSYEEFFPYGGTAFVAGDDTREVNRREYRYCGKECDDFTGLYCYGYRYYAPWIGRWLSPDPIGRADDLNLYQFVLGDPIGNVDDDGLFTIEKYNQWKAELSAKMAAANQVSKPYIFGGELPLPKINDAPWPTTVPPPTPKSVPQPPTPPPKTASPTPKPGSATAGSSSKKPDAAPTAPPPPPPADVSGAPSPAADQGAPPSHDDASTTKSDAFAAQRFFDVQPPLVLVDPPRDAAPPDGGETDDGGFRDLDPSIRDMFAEIDRYGGGAYGFQMMVIAGEEEQHELRTQLWLYTPETETAQDPVRGVMSGLWNSAVGFVVGLGGPVTTAIATRDWKATAIAFACGSNPIGWSVCPTVGAFKGAGDIGVGVADVKMGNSEVGAERITEGTIPVVLFIGSVVGVGEGEVVESGDPVITFTELTGGPANEVTGNAAALELAELMRKEGMTVDTQVYVRTPLGRRFTDIKVWASPSREEVLGYVEVKLGRSPYTRFQRAKDAWIRRFGGLDENILATRGPTNLVRLPSNWRPGPPP